MGQDISREFSKIQQPLSCCAPCNVDSKNGRGEVEDFRKVQTTEEVGCFTTQTLFAVVAVVVLVLVLFVVVEKVANDQPVVRSFQQKLRRKTRMVIASNYLCLCRFEFGSTTYVYINVYHRKFSLLLSGTNDPQTPSRQFTFRNMTRQDYFSLYDAIHTLVRQEEISNEQENTLYDLIGRQDKRLASAYQVTHNSATSYFLDFFLVPPAAIALVNSRDRPVIQGGRRSDGAPGRAQGPCQRRVRTAPALAPGAQRVVRVSAPRCGRSLKRASKGGGGSSAPQ